METRKWDPAERIETTEDALGYLSAVFIESNGDTATLQAAIGDVARAFGMSRLSHETGLARTSLYRALSEDGNPSFATINTIINALGGQLQVAPTRAQEAA